jgi:hypothetical protein
MRWAATSKDEFLTEAIAWVPDSDPTENSTTYDYFKDVGFWPLNGGIDTPSLETYLGYVAKLGVITGKVPTTDLWVDSSFVDNYLAANGKQ